MRKENSELKTAFVSEAGTFLHNRDYFAFVELDDMACWIAVDGIDADNETNTAEMVVRILMESFTEKPTMSRKQLKEYVLEAHDWLRYESRRVRLKASLVMVVTDYTRMVWLTAGNARLYHFRGGRLLEKSKDHSLAQRLTEDGSIAIHTADEHEERHNLLQYMGAPSEISPTVSKRKQLAEGDVLLLCTHGLWELVDETEMLDSLHEEKDAGAFVDRLEDVALSKQRPVVPNYTAAAVIVNKPFQEEKKSKKQLVKWIIVTMIPLIISVSLLLYFKGRAAARTAETVQLMMQSGQEGDAFAEDENYAEALKSYSEARAAANKVKDRAHGLLYSKKLKIAQTIVQADGYVKDGNYAKAVEQYKKAKSDAASDGHYDPAELDKRIASAEAFANVQAMVKQADLLAESQQYKEAIALYLKARKAATEASYPGGGKDITEKLEDANAKVAAIDKDKKKLLGELKEQKADRYFAQGDYEAAGDKYAEAQEMFQEIDMLDKVLAMERKIAKVDEKLHPPVPSTPAVDPAGAGAGTGGGGEAGANGGDGGLVGTDTPDSVDDPAGASENGADGKA
ncbi:serine/threonine protein phosphatase [Paenibacillus sp. MMS18-CY102]|uniref:serine/threonine protein phosphatase n=1 Tax=Paenibacillus sp. MMS18-CY102 TaxID=2682849 RepID=UPI001365A66F|nr:serine/threonine protein phosphatase [Paenibacillus sp. MMS18-CY102]MWC31334.1 serine/threonine protein phosphatase [Paenibacillus sp. MMS18-CY102]